MSLRDTGELSLVENIRDLFRTRRPSVITGIGDDCAVLSPQKGRLLATTDIMTEGVHFNLGQITPYQLGHKLVSVNVSDIYAMGGEPEHALLSLALPSSMEESFLNELLQGIKAALRQYRAALVGGDISSSRRNTTLAATVLGHAQKPVLRSGARPGDAVYVTGPLGDSACGFEILKRLNHPVNIDQPQKGPVPWKIMKPLLERHLMPLARKPGAIAKQATSMIDISDGLFIDLWRLASASRTGVRIYEDALPLSKEMLKAANALELDVLELATSGGEDYELLFTAPSNVRPRAHRIGEITRKDMVFVHTDGKTGTIEPSGYRHFG